MRKKKPSYRLLEHTADLGIRIGGSDLKDLFENAAMAMMDLLVRNRSVSGSSSRSVSISGQDLEELMVQWLGELLYLFDGEQLATITVKIDTLDVMRLDAHIETVPLDPAFHEILREIKAVTYHQIKVAREGDRWMAKVIFDI